MVLHNPNNWHWVNKDVSGWTKEYFHSKLVGLSTTGADDSVVKVKGVSSMEGDVDVSQRKGKVITLFDVKLTLEFDGHVKDVNVDGTITIPEVAHDTDEDDYVFDIHCFADSKEKEPAKELVRSGLVPQIRAVLVCLASDIVAEHGKDIQHAPGSGPVSGRSTPQVVAKPAKDILKSNLTHTTGNPGRVVNTTTLSDTYEFQTSAEELYKTFTDIGRVTAFTRSSVELDAVEGGTFRLFGGNVEGKFIKLQPMENITQTWRLKEWPEGHFSTQSLVFDQGRDSTTLHLTWQGVPVGHDDSARKNFNEYIIRSIKTTFGFGAVL